MKKDQEGHLSTQGAGLQPDESRGETAPLIVEVKAKNIDLESLIHLIIDLQDITQENMTQKNPLGGHQEKSNKKLLQQS